VIVFERKAAVIPSALAQQLQAAGVACLGVTTTDDGTLQIICADGTSAALVDATLAAYTPPAPMPPPLPAVGDIVDNAGAPAIVTAVDAVKGTVTVSPLAASATVTASSVTPVTP
jgi:hypothetical protein